MRQYDAKMMLQTPQPNLSLLI